MFIPNFVLIDVNECDWDPCGLNSTCSNTIGSYNCSCWRGYTPTNSSLPISTSNPCIGVLMCLCVLVCVCVCVCVCACVCMSVCVVSSLGNAQTRTGYPGLCVTVTTHRLCAQCCFRSETPLVSQNIHLSLS